MPAVVDVCGMEGTIYSATQRGGSPYRNAQIEEALFQMVARLIGTYHQLWSIIDS